MHDIEESTHDVIARAKDYEDGTFLDTHQHQRAQLLYSIQGMMNVETDAGKWLVLPYTAVWIPPKKPHSVKMLKASTRSLYLNPELILRGDQCEVVEVTPLLHTLLLSASELPVQNDFTERDQTLMALLIHEVKSAKSLPRYLPLPKHTKLLEMCRSFIAAPSIHSKPDDWAGKLHISTRTFSRLFMREVGGPFSEWRQQVCLLYALEEILREQPITHIALSLGYENTSAFSAMFKKSMGLSPREFIYQ